MLVLVAVALPFILLLGMLAMERLEKRLGRVLRLDEVRWTLRSGLPTEQVESRVAAALREPLEQLN